MFSGEYKQVQDILQLKDSSKPRVLGGRFQGLVDRAEGLCSVRLWRGLQGPSVETLKLGFFVLYSPTVRSGAAENYRAKGVVLTPGQVSALGGGHIESA